MCITIACGKVIAEIMIIDNNGIDIAISSLYDRIKNNPVKNKLSNVYGVTNFKKLIKLKFFDSFFKKLYSYFITFIECNITKYKVKPIINGKR
tara:strand:- start:242 stop:520 length:279 start_codon:yes stop_codon:yes gene_type:complete